MSGETQTVLVYLIPGQEGTAWFHAIAKKCKEENIFCFEAENEVSIDDLRKVPLVVVSWGGSVDGQFDHTLALAPSLESALSDAVTLYLVEGVDVTRRASESLAQASMLAERGVVMLASKALQHDFPLLGRVDRDDIAGVEAEIAHDRALAMYETLPPRRGSKAKWSSHLFFEHGDPPKEFTGGLIDMTGRARLIVFGPYLSLPPGRWGLAFDLDVDCQGQRLDLEFEWGAGDVLEAVAVNLTRDGVYRVNISGVWTLPGAAQFRIWLRKSSFAGRIRLGEMICERLDAPTHVVRGSDSLATVI